VEERNALMSTVYPQLKHFCHHLGYHLHIIDLYWNKEILKEEYSIAYDPHYLKKAIHEIKLCQEFSVGPCFMVSISQLCYILVADMKDALTVVPQCESLQRRISTTLACSLVYFTANIQVLIKDFNTQIIKLVLKHSVKLSSCTYSNSS